MDVQIGDLTRWEELRAVRLRVLADSPEAFRTSPESQRRMPEEAWRELLARRRWIVARAETGVIGVAAVECGFPTSRDAHLTSIWVDPAHRRRGVLRALLDAAASLASGAGVTGDLVLAVMEDNAVARRAYERLGFVPVDPPRSRGGSAHREVLLTRPCRRERGVV